MHNTEIIKKELSFFYENKIIFASELYKEKLFKKNVSEASFYKLLERMYQNNEIAKISKGIYYFPKKTKFGEIPISDNDIISIFVKNNEGMVVGYDLFNKLELTTQISKKYLIYSSNVVNKIKNIRNIEIKNVKIEFSKKNIRVIEMFEVLQNFDKIQDINYRSFYKYVSEFALEYNEKIVNYVISKMGYKKSTIAFLRNILNYFKVKNSLNQYLSDVSKYNHKTMEDIYELTQTQRGF